VDVQEEGKTKSIGLSSKTNSKGKRNKKVASLGGKLKKGHEEKK